MLPKPRVRFAPAPTGFMHLGNVRAALLNFLFARQTSGTFVLRIEDTDTQRNFDTGAQHIIHDLSWLSLTYDEGPNLPNMTVPYFQSERTYLYTEQLEILKQRKLVYRCFCTTEELEKKRQRQQALKQPPRYDRTCHALTPNQIDSQLKNKTPYVWRLELDHAKRMTIYDLAHGNITFDMSHFSDFPITRQDGSFTFIFSNFVDDMLMKISHVFRGEDHLSNSANQAMLYHYFNAPLPVFWHLPIITNLEGKKLSKRDFGFSLQDLRDAGFLPEAINNYLAIIGGSSYKQEIMSQEELIQTINFASIQSTGHIKYDVEKLRWINHQWITRISLQELVVRCSQLLHKAYPQAQELTTEKLHTLVQTVRTDLVTLNDIVPALSFYFITPEITRQQFLEHISEETIKSVYESIQENRESLNNHDIFIKNCKASAEKRDVKTPILFGALRIMLTGSNKGLGMSQLFSTLSHETIEKRIEEGLKCLAG